MFVGCVVDVLMVVPMDSVSGFGNREAFGMQ
jgi:hypothetical protein